MSTAARPEPVTAPRGWLRLALFGAFVYLASKLMAFYPDAASRATGVSAPALVSFLPVVAGAGLVLFLWGLVAAFWRLNRAAGHSGTGVAGLVAGALGVIVLAALVLLDLGTAFSISDPVVTALREREALATLIGTFLAFAGLATLGLGLARAGGLFGAPSRSPSRSPSGTPETSNPRSY